MGEKEETIDDIFAGRTLGEVMVAGAEEFLEELRKEKTGYSVTVAHPTNGEERFNSVFLK